MRLRNTLHHAVAVIASLLSTTSLTVDEMRRPNILWIVDEDMSPDFGCYGNMVVTTPNIDRLAARGMKFNSVFTTGPACSPSRTALATAVYQTTLGAHHIDVNLIGNKKFEAAHKELKEQMSEWIEFSKD